MKRGNANADRRRRAPPNGGERRAFAWLLKVAVVLVVGGWTASIVQAYRERANGRTSPAAEPPSFGVPAPKVAGTVSAALTDPRTRSSTAYLEDVSRGGYLGPLRGRSGKLRAVFRTPGAELEPGEEDPHLEVMDEGGGGGGTDSAEAAPADPGVYKLAVEVDKALSPLDDLKLITLVPFSEKKKDRIGLYYLGRWPYESGGTPRSASYANPKGFIEVTRENKDTAVSEHFKIGQFLTKDQFDVWPKYLLLEPKLLDKLELSIQELEKDGVDVKHVHVMSGFRTPRYNQSGGNTGGRANLSRHMYGDGVDVYVDNNRDGHPDDITGDGKVDTADAERFGRAVERVESRHPALVGGIGIYKACCGHGPFTHVDTRGYRARWRGTGTG
jgi:hypothetical protein